MAEVKFPDGGRLPVLNVPAFFPRLDALAERLGVEPTTTATGSMLLQGERGYYDLFDLANAFLDRLEPKQVAISEPLAGRVAAEILRRRQRIADEADAQYVALQADPQAAAELRAERQVWEATLLDGLSEYTGMGRSDVLSALISAYEHCNALPNGERAQLLFRLFGADGMRAVLAMLTHIARKEGEK